MEAEVDVPADPDPADDVIMEYKKSQRSEFYS